MKFLHALPALLLAASQCSCTLHSRQIIAQGDVQEAYDYIIAGGGLAGLVVASRLSEDPKVTVLVLETGMSGDAVANDINAPNGAYYTSIVGTDYDWKYTTVPQSNLNNRSIYWPRGKILGGSTAMNAMYLVRPSSVELDAWNTINGLSDTSTNGNWGWKSMYSFMKKSENFTGPGEELTSYLPIAYNASSYGSGGPMQASFPSLNIAAVSNWTSNLESIGIPESQNPNAGETMGGFITPSYINPTNWTRSYSRSAYIDSLPPRANLHIIPESTVLKIVLSTDRDSAGNLYAKGIQFAANPAAPRVTVGVRKEVILTAGPLGSPKILMHSGVGPEDVLTNASVPVKFALPGVGQHLQDHLTAAVVWNVPFETAGNLQESRSDFSKSPEFHSLINDAVAFVNMTTLFNGAEATAAFQKTIIDAMDTSAATLVPSKYREVAAGYKAIYKTLAEKFFSDGAQIELLMSVMSPGSVAIQAAMQHPFSSGRMYITSSNPFEQVTIDPHYYSHFADMVIMRQGLRLVRRVGAAFGAMFGAEVAPGPNIQTDDDLNAWLVNNGASTQYHPTASCAMLSLTDGGVVGTTLIVHGLANVRVADSSVFPFEFAAHLASATYGVAEQAAALIKTNSYNSPTVEPYSVVAANATDSTGSPGSPSGSSGPSGPGKSGAVSKMVTFSLFKLFAVPALFALRAL